MNAHDMLQVIDLDDDTVYLLDGELRPAEEVSHG